MRKNNQQRISLAERIHDFFVKLIITIALLIAVSVVTYLGAWIVHWFMGTPTPNELIQQAILWLGRWAPIVPGAIFAVVVAVAVLDQFAAGQAYQAENPWYRPEDPDAPWWN